MTDSATLASLSPAELEAIFTPLITTNMTTTTHRSVYPAISPTNPKLNQSGRVVLIPGGGTAVGYAIAHAFVLASATTVIIIGRRANVLASARTNLEQEAKTTKSSSKILSYTCDVTDFRAVDTLWKNFAADGIAVDVFVANAAKFTDPKPILELGMEEVWSQFDANVKAPLYFVEKFAKQGGDGQKFLINVSTQATHMIAQPAVTDRPGYTLTKLAGTHLFQVIAQHSPPEKMQVISFHPGLVYNDQWAAIGLSRDAFDKDDLCGGFAVWAATPEAAFLHGRFVWAAWDVTELARGEVRKRIGEDPYFLKCSIVGLDGGMKAN